MQDYKRKGDKIKADDWNELLNRTNEFGTFQKNQNSSGGEFVSKVYGKGIPEVPFDFIKMTKDNDNSIEGTIKGGKFIIYSKEEDFEDYGEDEKWPLSKLKSQSFDIKDLEDSFTSGDEIYLKITYNKEDWSVSDTPILQKGKPEQSEEFICVTVGIFETKNGNICYKQLKTSADWQLMQWRRKYPIKVKSPGALRFKEPEDIEDDTPSLLVDNGETPEKTKKKELSLMVSTKFETSLRSDWLKLKIRQNDELSVIAFLDELIVDSDDNSILKMEVETFESDPNEFDEIDDPDLPEIPPTVKHKLSVKVNTEKHMSDESSNQAIKDYFLKTSGGTLDIEINQKSFEAGNCLEIGNDEEGEENKDVIKMNLVVDTEAKTAGKYTVQLLDGESLSISFSGEEGGGKIDIKGENPIDVREKTTDAEYDDEGNETSPEKTSYEISLNVDSEEHEDKNPTSPIYKYSLKKGENGLSVEVVGANLVGEGGIKVEGGSTLEKSIKISMDVESSFKEGSGSFIQNYELKNDGGLFIEINDKHLSPTQCIDIQQDDPERIYIGVKVSSETSTAKGITASMNIINDEIAVRLEADSDQGGTGSLMICLHDGSNMYQYPLKWKDGLILNNGDARMEIFIVETHPFHEPNVPLPDITVGS